MLRGQARKRLQDSSRSDKRVVEKGGIWVSRSEWSAPRGEIRLAEMELGKAENEPAPIGE